MKRPCLASGGQRENDTTLRESTGTTTDLSLHKRGFKSPKIQTIPTKVTSTSTDRGRRGLSNELTDSPENAVFGFLRARKRGSVNDTGKTGPEFDSTHPIYPKTDFSGPKNWPHKKRKQEHDSPQEKVHRKWGAGNGGG